MSARRSLPQRDHPEVTGVRSISGALQRAISEEPRPLPEAPRPAGRDQTRMVPRAAQQPQPLLVRDLFRHRLDMIRRAYLGTPENAVWVAAIDPGRGVAGAVRIHAPADGGVAHMVIGRHERCDLRLTDPALSLRHSVLVIRRLETGDLRVRLIDLRSGLGLTGEDGRPLESVALEGHLFVGMGRYVLMVLLGGEDLAFSDDGDAVYDALPPRVYFDHRERVPQLLSPRRPRLMPPDEWTGGHYLSGTGARARARGINVKELQSRVDILPAPEPLHIGAMDADRMGTLTIRCEGGLATVPLHESQVRDGVLLGRYDRCDSSDLPFDLPETVSRVHALILREANQTLVLDTSSTFGVKTAAGQEVRLLTLDGAKEFMLGEETHLSWSPEDR